MSSTHSKTSPIAYSLLATSMLDTKFHRAIKVKGTMHEPIFSLLEWRALRPIRSASGKIEAHYGQQEGQREASSVTVSTIIFAVYRLGKRFLRRTSSGKQPFSQRLIPFIKSKSKAFRNTGTQSFFCDIPFRMFSNQWLLEVVICILQETHWKASSSCFQDTMNRVKLQQLI